MFASGSDLGSRCTDYNKTRNPLRELMADTAAHIATRLPAVPLTLEGHSVLHQMFRFRWAEWRKLDNTRHVQIAEEVEAVFSAAEGSGQTALYSMLGHKGDLMVVHFR